MIVLATAGRDAGRYFLVTGLCGSDLLLSDGRTRMLAAPKRKNPAHVQSTALTCETDGLTDKALRQVLHPLNNPVPRGQSKRNQIRKEVIDDVETGCN